MTTTEPCVCAHPVELRSQAEIEAERQHYKLRAEALWPGWKLLPLEPTLEMLHAPSTVVQPYAAGLIYKRMVAALDLGTPAPATEPAVAAAAPTQAYGALPPDPSFVGMTAEEMEKANGAAVAAAEA